MKTALFWILWGIASFLALKAFYYTFSKEKFESLRKAALSIHVAIFVLSLLPWIPPALGGESALSFVLQGDIPAVLFFSILIISTGLFFRRDILLLKIAASATIVNTFILFIFMYGKHPGSFVLSLYDIAPIIAFLFLLISDVLGVLLWQQMKLQKEKKGNDSKGRFLQNKIDWFQRLSKLKKGIIIAVGILLLFLILAPSRRKPENNKPSVHPAGENSIAGSVVDQNGKPIDGAVIAGLKNMVVSASDGTYKIQTNSSDTLTASAFGYETTHFSASQPVVTLSALTPGSVRVVVVSPDNKEVKDALIYRLNANTFVPSAIGITNTEGEVVFQNVPSGQTAFVVLHPDYSFAWLETSLDPGSSIRPVVRLAKLGGEKKSANVGFELINKAYAQSPTEVDFKFKDKLMLEEATSEKIDDKTYNILEESETILAVGTDRKKLQNFIDDVKFAIHPYEFESKPPVGIYGEAGQRLDEIIKKEGSPLTVIRTKEGPYDVQFTVEDGSTGKGQEGNYFMAWKSEQRNIIVQIDKRIPDQSVAVLRAQHAVTPDNKQPVTVTSWTAADAAELAGAKQVIFNQPRVTVCCNRPNADTGAGGAALPLEVSSDNSPPTDLKLTNTSNDEEYFHTSFKKSRRGNGRSLF